MDLTSSSTSNSPIIIKVLIDLDEYLRIESKQKHFEEQEKKFKEQLVTSKIENQKENQVEQGSSGENIQTENTAIHQFDANTLKYLAQLVASELRGKVELEPESETNQIGSGASDFITQIPEPLTTNHDPAYANATLLIQGDENTPSNEIALLQNIPESFKSNAKKLLDAFSQRPDQLTWNSTGTIFINNISLPETDIYKLLPAAFRPTLSNRKLPGFQSFITQIATMGLAHLINNSLLRGLRRKYLISNANEIYKETINGNWWYIG